MEKDRVTAVISDVINAAADAKSWSLAQLTRHLGKGENTLHRWKTGATTAYDMSTIVKLFKMAGMSMDQAFNIPTTDDTMTQSNQERLEKLTGDVREIRLQLASLEPVLNLVALISDAAAGAKIYTAPKENVRRRRTTQQLDLGNVRVDSAIEPADETSEPKTDEDIREA